jgi:hypothetical protein
MAHPKIYADFHNADPQGRLRLNCVGTAEDLSRAGVELREGMVLTLYSDDVGAGGESDEMLADGIVSFSEAEHCWVATIDWDAFRHASDESAGAALNGHVSAPASGEPNRSPAD